MAGEDQTTDAEKALRESEYRYRNLFQAMAAAFWELDFSGVGGLLRGLKKAGVTNLPAHFAAHPDFVREMMRATRVLDVNDQAVALFGHGDKQAMLQTVEPFWPETSNAVYAASVVAAVTGKPSYSAETRLRNLDGREFDVHFTACFPAESVADGKLLIGVIDISQRVEAQAMLQRLQAEFAHAARISMLGELTASIAHEVNQPLAAIATNASAGLRWLDRPEPDVAEVRQLTTRIITDAGRAADIIARVRSMATRRATERAPLSINAVIEEAALFLRHELQGQGVKLALDLPASLPAILGDRTQLQQVLVNLMVNAVQAMASSPEKRLALHSRQNGGTIEVTVEDSGPGISAENMARLFESFFTTKEAGMGMGLPICRSIIGAHGGRIEASNSAAAGACFRIVLPLAPAA